MPVALNSNRADAFVRGNAGISTTCPLGPVIVWTR